MQKYNTSEKQSTTQAWGTKAPGTALDLIWFSPPSLWRKKEIEELTEDIMPVSCVWYDILKGLGGIVTVNPSMLVSTPMAKPDYAFSCLFE